jgi:hypothetical protein
MFFVSDIPSLIGWLVGIVPSFVLMCYAWMSRGEPWRWSILFSGILLIALALHMAQLFISLVTFVDEHSSQPTTTIYLAHLKSSSSFWLTAFPLLAGGVGVNLVSEFILAKKPGK